MDEDAIITTTFGLPPVSTTPEIGVFGRISHLASDSVTGSVVSGSSATPVSRGQKLLLESRRGVDSGKNRPAPLISSGQPTENADLAGTAAVRIDGRSLSHLWWLPWLLGAIGAAVVSVVVEGLLSWAGRGTSDPPNATAD